MDKKGKGFTYICENCFYKSETKLKQGIFSCPERKKLLKNYMFETKLLTKELVAWKPFKSVV